MQMLSRGKEESEETKTPPLSRAKDTNFQPLGSEGTVSEG